MSILLSNLFQAIALLFSLSGDGAVSGQAHVVDGDTIDVEGTRVRLGGIDSPESGQFCRDASGEEWRCGEQATLALTNLLSGEDVRCEFHDRDDYDRLIGTCFRDGVNINREMVREGWAIAYRYYTVRYVKDEEAAKSSAKGIWRGEFISPWDWRRGRRLPEPNN